MKTLTLKYDNEIKQKLDNYREEKIILGVWVSWEHWVLEKAKLVKKKKGVRK